MKKSLQLSLAFLALAFSFTASATDLCVNENGNGGCYTTISAAVAAATNGDRILITPKAGGAPYVENVTVNKTLQFLCATEAGQYTVQGNFTIVPIAGRAVTIIGMNNLQGNILATTDSPSGARTKVNILGSTLADGYVNFDYNNFDVNVSSNVFSKGYVAIRYGKILGNEITTQTSGYYSGGNYASVYIGNDATATNDSIFIVGNKIFAHSAGSNSSAVRTNSGSQFYYIVNNLLVCNNNYYTYGLMLDGSWKSSTLGRNTIQNNTFSTNNVTGVYVYGFYIASTPANAYVDVINNLILAPNVTSGGYGIYGYVNSGVIGVSYNIISSPLAITALTYDPNNNLTSNTTLDVNYRPNTGTDAINGGSSDYSYYDINLTVNDAGAYGGSFTLDNFFPQTGGARVYFVQAPRRVSVGTAIDIKAETFDR
jgi:hypothetical protein